MTHAQAGTQLMPDKWVSLAVAGKNESREYLRAPCNRDGIVYALDGYRVHIAPADSVNMGDIAPVCEKLRKGIDWVSQSLLTARKGTTVTFPASLIREVSGVMGREGKGDCNILRVTLFPDRAEFDRVRYMDTQSMDIHATVSKTDGYTVSGTLPDDGLTIGINPGYLLDALSALPAAHSKGKRKGEHVDSVRISVADAHKAIAVDYGKLSAVIMPMTLPGA